MIERHANDRFAWREAQPAEQAGPAVLLVHGFPESSLMWEPLMGRLAAAGRFCVAPDLYGLGDSPDTGPATFERNVEALTTFVEERRLGPVVLVVHDWGGFVGLAWACEHPGLVEALVISDTGFFADGHWHGLAEAIRGPEGEALVALLDRPGFGELLKGLDDAAVDAYWRPFETGAGQRAALDFYRSMDFAKLAPYEGRLAGLAVPTLVLWGAEDAFASVKAAHRFHREIAGSELLVVQGAGHFVFDEEPARCIGEVTRFLGLA